MAILKFFQLISCPSQSIYHRVKFRVTSKHDLHLCIGILTICNCGIYIG